jgi:hypothetical protein
MQAEHKKQLEEAQIRHKQELSERDQQLARTQEEACKAAAVAEERIASEIQKHNDAIQKVREAGEKQKRLDAAKPDSRHRKKLPKASSTGALGDVRHQLDVKIAEVHIRSSFYRPFLSSSWMHASPSLLKSYSTLCKPEQL